MMYAHFLPFIQMLILSAIAVVLSILTDCEDDPVHPRLQWFSDLMKWLGASLAILAACGIIAGLMITIG